MLFGSAMPCKRAARFGVAKDYAKAIADIRAEAAAAAMTS
jgi:hypothetical protein